MMRSTIFRTVKLGALGVVLLAQSSDVALAQLEILPAGAPWRILTDGGDQKTAWRHPEFDDSSWDLGVGPFGFGDVDLSYVIEVDRTDQPLTYYFRNQFEVSNTDEYPVLRLSYTRDDGMILYLNGREVHRSNLPAGDVTFDTLASDSVDGPNERAVHEIYLPATVLQNGVNTIAAEIHQASPFSSDLRFGIDLTLTELSLPEQTLPVGTGFETAPAADPLFSMQLPIVESGLLQGEPLESRQLGITDSLLIVESSPINVVGFSSFQVALDFRSEDNGSLGSFDGGSFLTVECRVSSDGEKFDSFRWLNLKSGGKNWDQTNRGFATYTSDLTAAEAVEITLRLMARASEGSALYLDNFRITGVPVVVDSYQAFLTSTTNWLLDDVRRGPGHDPDDDDLPNLLEYAFQMNPSTRQSGAAALPEFAVNEDGTVTMTYCQIDAPTEGSANAGFRVQDLIYIPQISFGDRTATGEFIWIGGEGDGEVFEDTPAVERFDGKGLVRVALKSREPLGNSSQQMFGRILVRLNE